MDEAVLKELLAGLPLGSIRFYDRTGSTNDEAARWAEADAPHLSLVVADEQTAGRGRLGRRWYTPPGGALAFSLILRSVGQVAGQDAILPCVPYLPNEGIPRLTALGALAVCDALRQEYSLDPQIKWPNDVLLEGCKVAGVLAEADWEGERLGSVILGIGINVAVQSVPPQDELLFPATCVEAALGKPVERWALLRAVLQALLQWLPRLNSMDFLRTWEGQLAFRGKWVRITFKQGSSLKGVVLGLNPDGALRLRLPTGEVTAIQFGELNLRPVDRYRKSAKLEHEE